MVILPAVSRGRHASRSTREIPRRVTVGEGVAFSRVPATMKARYDYEFSDNRRL